VQGEGGVNPAKEELVQAARVLCDQFNASLIFDEIQTGIGRSGYLFTYQKLGVTPDILTTAKGLGGGFPIGAMLTTSKIAESLKVGTHGSTFGGNPMACAVASKVLEIVAQPGMLASVREKNRLLLTELEKINGKYAVFSEIRGDGLLLGCELSGQWQGRAREILTRCTQNGLLILMAGANVLRLAPALNIENRDIVAAVEIIGDSILQLSEAT
jgi:acetylornithine/succinyldiaminopimelate/putrescine aminotransferase